VKKILLIALYEGKIRVVGNKGVGEFRTHSKFHEKYEKQFTTIY
jgi:hypothetical protein